MDSPKEKALRVLPQSLKPTISNVHDNTIPFVSQASVEKEQFKEPVGEDVCSWIQRSIDECLKLTNGNNVEEKQKKIFLLIVSFLNTALTKCRAAK